MEECERSPGSEAEEEGVAGEVWLCLQCGHPGCGREGAGQHALAHAEKQRTGVHSVALAVPVTFDLWCYACDAEPDAALIPSGIAALVEDVVKPLLRKHAALNGDAGEEEAPASQPEKPPKKSAALPTVADCRIKVA